MWLTLWLCSSDCLIRHLKCCTRVYQYVVNINEFINDRMYEIINTYWSFESSAMHSSFVFWITNSLSMCFQCVKLVTVLLSVFCKCSNRYCIDAGCSCDLVWQAGLVCFWVLLLLVSVVTLVIVGWSLLAWLHMDVLHGDRRFGFSCLHSAFSPGSEWSLGGEWAGGGDGSLG